VTCRVHIWGRSRITRGITGVLLSAVVVLGFYLLVHGAIYATLPASMSPVRLAPVTVYFLANYFWLASICFGFIGTLRFSVYKEVTSCPICSKAGDPPFYRDPATAFHRYITMVIVSTLAAFLAVLISLFTQ
jgi:hypothetical protein